MPLPTFKLTDPARNVKMGWLKATAEMISKSLPLGPYMKRYGGKPPPAKVDYHSKAQRTLKEMLGNDQYGDCVVAAVAHGVGVMTANEPGGTEQVPTTQEVVKEYQRICGPGDNGCYIPRVLDTFRDSGIHLAGKSRRIEGYVRVNPRDQLLVKTAGHMFGGLHLGVNWPREWMAQAKPGGVLRPTNSPMVGGHAVQVVGHDDTGLIISTWGIVCHLSWDALTDPRYVDECYAMLSDDWFDEKGATAAGLDVTKLRADLKVIAGGGLPDYPENDDPDPAPPQPPAPTPGAVWEWLKEFDVMGFTVHAHLALLRRAAHGAGGASWWSLLSLAWELYRAVAARDWAGALSAAQRLAELLAELFDRAEYPKLAEFARGAHKALTPAPAPGEEPGSELTGEHQSGNLSGGG